MTLDGKSHRNKWDSEMEIKMANITIAKYINFPFKKSTNYLY